MTQITSYATLQTEAAAMYGNGRTDLTARWPGFIQRCEEEVNRFLRTSSQTTFTTLTAASGVLTVPADYARMRSLRQTEANKPQMLKTDIVQIEDWLNEATQTGDPIWWCEHDGTVYLAPAPEDGVTFRVFYVPKVAALSDANTTNWLLDEHSDVYLFGTLKQAAIYDHDDGALDNYEAAFANALAGLKRIEAEDKFGDRIEMMPNGGVA